MIYCAFIEQNKDTVGYVVNTQSENDSKIMTQVFIAVYAEF